MTGFGPRRGSEADCEPAAGTVDRDAAAAMAHQFYTDGQKSITHGGYRAGHDMAFDVGYGARNDHVRSFVAGVLEGHDAGMAARRELLEAIATQRVRAAVPQQEAQAVLGAGPVTIAPSGPQAEGGIELEPG
jgi:hypothetical protein